MGQNNEVMNGLLFHHNGKPTFVPSGHARQRENFLDYCFYINPLEIQIQGLSIPW
jgi:hypothetical protein